MNESPFLKYEMYSFDSDGNIIDLKVNPDYIADEAFELLKDLYDLNYGSIKENENLISIHTGGWSENEYLISEFKKTVFWIRYHKITAAGGHYYFNTDIHSENEWIITTLKP